MARTLNKQALVGIENFLAVQELEIDSEAVGLLTKHRGMRGADEADHHQNKFIVSEGDGSHESLRRFGQRVLHEFGELAEPHQ